jgi:hypothetical protein
LIKAKEKRKKEKKENGTIAIYFIHRVLFIN